MTVYKLKAMGGEENEDCQCVHIQVELLITLHLAVFAYLKKIIFPSLKLLSLFYEVKGKNLDLG